MQSRRANVICVRLHTRKLTRRPIIVGLPDNDKASSPYLREQISYSDERESLSAKANMPKAYICLQSPHVAGSHHVALPAAGVINMGS